MTLQSKLFASFVALVMVPLSAAALIGAPVIVRELEGRTRSQLKPAAVASQLVYEQKVAAARVRVDALARDPQLRSLVEHGGFAAIEPVLARAVDGGRTLDYVVIAGPAGELLAGSLSASSYVEGIVPPAAPDIAVGAVGAHPESWKLLADPATATIVGPDRRPIAHVVGGWYFDNGFLAEIEQDLPDLDATVFLQGRAIATTSGAPGLTSKAIDLDLSATGEGDLLEGTIGTEVYAARRTLVPSDGSSRYDLVVSIPKAVVARVTSKINNWIVTILLLTVLAAAVLGFRLARAIARPIKELAAGADAIARGNYEQHITVRSGAGEIGQLSTSFNEMARRLSLHVAELQESREELKRALSRFGETLRATHDLGAILQVVFDTSMDALRAQRGALFLMTGTRDALRGRLARGMMAGDLEFNIGVGLAGRVAAEGRPIRVPADEPAEPLDGEQPYRTALAVPLFQQERVMGVVVLYDREDDQNFSEADMSTLISLADQAGVAIENVFLHERAKRLAITDGLTGIWNRRYFQMQFEQEMERSVRFRRPFTLVLLDIDDFKTINDTYGHQQGDSVLIELAARIKGGIRDIDVVARYGGEEFALILPETDGEGGRSLGEKIRALVEGTPFAGSPPIKVTISAGVACFPEHGADARSIEAAADSAMYFAKSLGKNRVVVCGEE
ncbi:MAG: diguanylate cyclase, partial [Actinomycetota bacterium]